MSEIKELTKIIEDGERINQHFPTECLKPFNTKKLKEERENLIKIYNKEYNTSETI